jgi:hypothetical protein
VVAILALFAVAGCKEAKLDVPETYPVTGTVLDRAGKPLADAHVQLRPASGADNLLIINGVSGADGAFTLRTLHMNDAAQKTARDGAPPGEYRVTIMPKVEYDQLKGPPPTVTAKPQTIKVEPKENTFKFEVVIASPK